MAIQDQTNIPPVTFSRDVIRQIRTGRVKSCLGIPDRSAIFKTPRFEPVKVGHLGCEGDERAFIKHIGPDNALMHYPSKYYELWKAEYPQNAHLFTVGAFGENLVSDVADEKVLCIGDILRLGDEVVVQVSHPRQPCYKLNHRFEMKDMSLLCQTTGRTGWYYRVLTEGYIKPGDELVLMERKYPQWSLANVQRYLNEEPYRRDEAVMVEFSQMPELSTEVREIFGNRAKKIFKNDNLRLQGGTDAAFKWHQYRLVKRRKETPRISSFTLEAVEKQDNPAKAQPGSHIRVKLGADQKLVRAYSIVDGDANCFTLGISLDPGTSRGGSQYFHDNVKVDNILICGEIRSDFPLIEQADEHIFIAGGIGITAFIASAKKLKEEGMQYHLYYAVRSEAETAFKEELDQFGSDVSILNGSQGQRLDLEKIIGKARNTSHIYVCGPERLLEGTKKVAQAFNFPESNVHSEAFTIATSGDPFSVELEESQKVLQVSSEQTLLDVLRDAGFDVPSTCEVGNCGTCKVSVKKGRVEHRGTGLLDSEKEGCMLSCVSRGIGSITLDM